ncbi:MAG: pilus assembly protein [Sphingomonadales bacterium]|nr:pilus assembly protein [Sphingomonadales bacterium]
MTHKSKFTRISKFLSSVKKDESGLALVEFAVSLPFFMGLTIGGVEVANFASINMQLNQIAIHTADSAARMGEGNALSEKRIRELDVMDVFEGTLREGDRIALSGNHTYIDPITKVPSIRGNARIILSSVEEVADFDDDDPEYRIRWQRCSGTATRYVSTYGHVGDTFDEGIGPDLRKVTPPPEGALMFVELHYFFRPMILNGFTKLTDRDITQIASMVVRDKRDYAGPSGGEGIYSSTGVTPDKCLGTV